MAIRMKTKKDLASTLTVEDLAEAIKNSIDEEGMGEKEARAMAQHVLNFFGYSERIIDNVLEPEDRDAFYILEDSGLLTTEREETTLYDGREWRIHYWLFKKDKIIELMKHAKKHHIEAKEEKENIYDEVPEDIWSQRENDLD
jgi:transcription initiation factor IIE alpha subunit